MNYNSPLIPQNQFQRWTQSQQMFQPYSIPSTRHPQSNPQTNPQIDIQQVTSIDEARAQIINPVGISMFCNFGNNEIYIKHLDNNGQGQFHIFRLVNETPKI